ncbi:alpha-L-arabinofuranosidase B [Xylariaceae sp. FL0255]|nr:alpha-L-arabinofuranosidase B [Xylariaceae sp. FL0255]
MSPSSRTLKSGVLEALVPLFAAAPCVAAHSTTRSLFSAYAGSLYQVQRADGATQDIGTVSAGGIADAGSQDSFCSGSACIYDQSENNNHLTVALPGGNSSGTGYRNDATTNIPTGDSPQGIYAVLDGTHYNDQCCFDYGNAETNNLDNGAGHMQALYFGTSYGASGSGSGPWIMADLENDLVSGENTGLNSGDPSISSRFVTGVLKGMPNYWEILTGDSTTGSLNQGYAGVRPAGYNPMSQEGALILGIGGDNSNGGEGTFYEGVITSGFPSDDVDNQVQAAIVAAGYSA